MKLLLFFLLSTVISLPQPPDHSFEKKVLQSQSCEANETPDTRNKKCLSSLKRALIPSKKEGRKQIVSPFPVHQPSSLLGLHEHPSLNYQQLSCPHHLPGQPQDQQATFHSPT